MWCSKPTPAPESPFTTRGGSGSWTSSTTAALAAHPDWPAWAPSLSAIPSTPPGCAAAFAGRKQGAKTLLLDQHIVAGLGNIYVCEVLHRAGFRRSAPAGGIRRRPLERLVDAIRAVLAEAIDQGGSTLRDFAAADGALGYFQHNFEVYDREGQACLKPSCRGVIGRVAQAGRSTFFCPVCQK